MSIDLDIFCFSFTFMMLFSTVFSIAIGVVGCECPVSDRDVRVDVYFCQFSNNPPNSASVVDAMIFLTMLNSTCTGPFSGVIDFISVPNFIPRKK